tara:strand:- start:2690 stop:3154 length:465 start_codon:yes stop_codon:yes gene_type:complete
MTVYDQQIMFDSVSNVTATNSVDVGTERKVGDESYLYVYNAGNSDIPPSYGCVLSAVTGYSATLSSITGVDFLVGVVKHSTLTTATYGWIMTRGFAAIEMEADNSAIAGQILALAADGEFALKSNSTGYPTPAVGKTMEAIASGASGQAFISVR